MNDYLDLIHERFLKDCKWNLVQTPESPVPIKITKILGYTTNVAPDKGIFDRTLSHFYNRLRSKKLHKY